MGTMSINGRTYDVPSGASVSVVNGVVTIGGVAVDSYPRSAQVVVNVTGDVGSLDADGSVTVAGGVKGDATAGGSLTVGAGVGGGVAAGGSVRCGDVRGSVSAGGSVRRG